jgi:hypothetical protein
MKYFSIGYLAQRHRRWLIVALTLCWMLPAWSDTMPEYRLKAAFLYNFATFTEWPTEIGERLNLCIYGADPFGDYLHELQDKKVGNRRISIRREINLDRLVECQVVFIARSANNNLLHIVGRLRGKPVLTVADAPDAALQGVALNMGTEQNKITFEANLSAARGNGLTLSSKLLRLATKVYP